jgi:hypothetical protein
VTDDIDGDGDVDDKDAWLKVAMSLDPTGLYAAAVATGSTNTVHVCTWCEGALKTMQDDKSLEKKMAEGKKGDDIKELHEHLKRFGFTLDLQTNKGKTPKDSPDLEKDTWGKYTQRAVKLFASHPKVGAEAAAVITADGKKLTSAIADKIREWCRTNTVSPQHYWEFPQLSLTGGELDAFGADKKDTPEKQAALHHYVKEIQDDLAKIGFGVHDDDVCGIGKDHVPTGEYHVIADDKDDKKLADTKHLVRRFQRQAKWLWRMQSDGTHLADVKETDPSFFRGTADGVMNAETAAVLHHWATHDLHMVIDKFELVQLDWPPGSGTPIKIDKNTSSQVAKLRKDAHDAWLAAAKEIFDKGGSIEGPYSSSPRGWRAGKLKNLGAGNGNSAYSWHYSGLAVDIGQHLATGDGTISNTHRHVREEDGSKFRLWCWVVPQPAAPADPADDKKDPLLQYRNRNIKALHRKDATASAVKDASKPSDPSPLYTARDDTNAAHSDKVQVTVKEGWYVDCSAILEAHGMKRIPRHSDWLDHDKGWEWWHYQFEPDKPSPTADDLTFGDYLQLYGVHEYLLRTVPGEESGAWSAHKDIDHRPG